MYFIDEKHISETLKQAKEASSSDTERIIEKALKLKGLSPEETAVLISCQDQDLLSKIFDAAKKIKELIYGNRLVIFAPLYLSNSCINNCLYCGFRHDNKDVERKTLRENEIKREVGELESQGHKRLLLVASEDKEVDINYLEEAIKTVYETKDKRGAIRRVNINSAPMGLDEFKRLKKTGIGTYQLFQETYHHETYGKLHPQGPKSDYKTRLYAMDLAQTAGIDDVGIGVLFGLFDYRFEVLALLYHSLHLEERFNVGPHTISVPRIEPAKGAPFSFNPSSPVSDDDFRKIVAVLRLAVPYTGLILSTREAAGFRNELLDYGISQISAGSRTSPGGYTEKEKELAQFSLCDHRTLAEVIDDVVKRGFIPSFCTACYRLGRTGEDFMDFAKPGDIKNFCHPNAILTFVEYLLDYHTNLNGQIEEIVNREIEKIPDEKIRFTTHQKIQALKEGKRDLYF